MYTLTITCENLDTFVELARLIDANGLNLLELTEKGVGEEPKKKAEAPKEASEVQARVRKGDYSDYKNYDAPSGQVTGVTIVDSEITVIDYNKVKDAVLSVAKKLGREASLDLLAFFNVVTGEGDDRKGNIKDLKPEQYADVIKKSKEMLKPE